MNLKEIEDFLKTHWAAALIVLIVTTPVIWSAASIHYSQQISTLRERVGNLELKLEDLNEYKKRIKNLETDRRHINYSETTVIGISKKTEPLVDALYNPSIENN